MSFDLLGDAPLGGYDVEMQAAMGSFALGCNPPLNPDAAEEEVEEPEEEEPAGDEELEAEEEEAEALESSTEAALSDQEDLNEELNMFGEEAAEAQAADEGLCLVRNPHIESGFCGVQTCLNEAGQKVYRARRRSLDAGSSTTRERISNFFTCPAQAALQYARWVGSELSDEWATARSFIKSRAQAEAMPLPDEGEKRVRAALAIATAAHEGLTLEAAPGTMTGYKGVK